MMGITPIFKDKHVLRLVQTQDVSPIIVLIRTLYKKDIARIMLALAIKNFVCMNGTIAKLGGPSSMGFQ